jgi:PBP1b-binding outer membrane lipoprotein LpoB
MKKLSIIFLMLFVASFILQSCSKEEVTASGSRDVKYEITGNFSGSIILVATTNKDEFEVIEIKKLPWTLEFTAKSSIETIVASGSGTDGVEGQTATLKTYVGGKEVSSGGGSTTSFGSVSMSNKLYFFK